MEPQAFRNLMSEWPSGVAVVTTAFNGSSLGITVSSFISVSVAPPSILISIDKASPMITAIRKTRKFALTMLREDQVEVSTAFATHGSFKFNKVLVNLETGLPYVEGLATIFVDLKGERHIYDHVLFIGNPVLAEVKGGKPLIYWKRGYRNLGSKVYVPSSQ